MCTKRVDVEPSRHTAGIELKLDVQSKNSSAKVVVVGEVRDVDILMLSVLCVYPFFASCFLVGIDCFLYYVTVVMGCSKSTLAHMYSSYLHFFVRGISSHRRRWMPVVLRPIELKFDARARLPLPFTMDTAFGSAISAFFANTSFGRLTNSELL